MVSSRWMAPVPTLELSEPILTRLAGFALPSEFSRPKKLVRLASSELVRVRVVELSSLAVSATVTFTVITSPICMARGSWKKLWAFGCHSELSICVMGCGLGISDTILLPAGIAHRIQLGGLTDIGDPSTAEQAESEAAGQQQGGDFQEGCAHGWSYRRAMLLAGAAMMPVARTVPGAVTTAEIMR